MRLAGSIFSADFTRMLLFVINSISSRENDARSRLPTGRRSLLEPSGPSFMKCGQIALPPNTISTNLDQMHQKSVPFVRLPYLNYNKAQLLSHCYTVIILILLLLLSSLCRTLTYVYGSKVYASFEKPHQHQLLMSFHPLVHSDPGSVLALFHRLLPPHYVRPGQRNRPITVTTSVSRRIATQFCSLARIYAYLV